MKQYMAEIIWTILWLYFLIALFVWMIRAIEMDCAHRYVDYVFPISKLHCEINKE